MLIRSQRDTLPQESGTHLSAQNEANYTFEVLISSRAAASGASLESPVLVADPRERRPRGLLCPMCPHLGDTEDARARGRPPKPLWGQGGQHRFASRCLTCIPHTWKTKAKPRTTHGIWFFCLVSSVSPCPPSMENSSPCLLSWVHFFFP